MDVRAIADFLTTVKLLFPKGTINYNDQLEVTLADGRVKVVSRPDPIEGLSSVPVVDRIGYILGGSILAGTEITAVHYWYDRGYEQLARGKGGNFMYCGSYHPDIFCEGDGVCQWCGCTMPG